MTEEAKSRERATLGGAEEGTLQAASPLLPPALGQGVSLLHHRLRPRKGQAPDPCESEEGAQRQGEMVGLPVSSDTSVGLSVRREHWARRTVPAQL